MTIPILMNNKEDEQAQSPEQGGQSTPTRAQDPAAGEDLAATKVIEVDNEGMVIKIDGDDTKREAVSPTTSAAAKKPWTLGASKSCPDS